MRIVCYGLWALLESKARNFIDVALSIDAEVSEMVSGMQKTGSARPAALKVVNLQWENYEEHRNN